VFSSPSQRRRLHTTIDTSRLVADYRDEPSSPLRSVRREGRHIMPHSDSNQELRRRFSALQHQGCVGVIPQRHIAWCVLRSTRSATIARSSASPGGASKAMDDRWITCTERKRAMKRFSTLPLALALLVLIVGLGRVPCYVPCLSVICRNAVSSSASRSICVARCSAE